MNRFLKTITQSDCLKAMIIGLLVVIGTFPNNDWAFSLGIDPPLSWVFNYLFTNGSEIGKGIIFPHGPLAFFMYPLAENIALVTFVTSVLKILLVFNVGWLLSNSNNKIRWFIAFFFAYFISIVSGFNHLILANILLLYSNFYNSENRIYKYIAFLLTAFAFYIKAYVAILSGIVFVSFILYYLFRTKKIKQILIDALILFALIFIFWVSIYGSFSGFFQYIWGVLNLAQDNSSAAAYYPVNNWLVLFLFFVTMVLLFAVNRTKESLFFSVLIILSLFAAWKHGMAREDVYHVKSFLLYVIIVEFIFVIYFIKNFYISMVIAITSVLLLSINIENSVNYKPQKYEIVRVSNFINFFTHYSNLKEKSEANSLQNIKANKLPTELIDVISNSPVDVYPWDYSIIPANNLNWQPRVVIQSYAAYTSWLDAKNADHFKSDIAPEFIIWQLNKISKDVNGSNFNSIDNRYLLNDEPQTIFAILQNYKFVMNKGGFVLLQKRVSDIHVQLSDEGKLKTVWNKWNKVPESKNDLLRVKLNFSKSLLQSIKSFLYKDEQSWMYLKLRNGSIHKYRIVPKNAQDGLWVNPYIYNTNKAYIVDSVMFVNSNNKIINNEIELGWESIQFENKENYIFEFMNIDDYSKDSVLLKSANNFEHNNVPYWSNIPDDAISTIAITGDKAHLLKSNSYSATFEFKLDSIDYSKIKIETDCWIKASNYAKSKKISLVISIDDGDGNVVWKGVSIDTQIIDKDVWNNVFNYVDFDLNKPNCTLKIYIWNKSDTDILMDDFKVLVSLI